MMPINLITNFFKKQTPDDLSDQDQMMFFIEETQCLDGKWPLLWDLDDIFANEERYVISNESFSCGNG